MNFNGKSFVQTMQRHPKYYDGTILRTYHTKPVPGEKQKQEIEQENAKKANKAKNNETEITNLLSFKKKHAYA